MKKILLFVLIITALSSCMTSKTASTGDGKIAPVQVFGLPKPISPYSSAVWAGDFCYVSGQLATDAISGKMPEGGIKEEVQGVMRNLETVLKSADLGFSNVVKSTVYLTDFKDFQTMNDVYKTYFKNGQYPARETVQIAALARGAHVEISVIAYKKR